METDTSTSDQALRLSEERFRVVADSLHDHGLIMMDEHGAVRSWNTGAATVFGYRPEEIVGKHCSVFELPEDRERRTAEHELELAERDGSASDDRWLQRKSGERFYANGTTTAMRGEDGRLLGFCKIVRDRTEQRRLEEDLASQRDRLEFAQNVGRIGTFEWEIGTDRELWTQGMYRLYGIPDGSFKGSYRHWITMLHPDDVRMVEKALSEAIAYHQPAMIEFRILLPGGGHRWLALSGKAVYDDAGRPLRLVGIQVDIDERKRFEETLEHSNHELQQFAQVASHDMQEPLRMITSYLRLLQYSYGPQLDDRAHQYLGFAVDGAARLQRLIASLLKFARYERDALRIERVPSQHAFAEAVENLGERIAETGGTVVHGDLPEVMADREHLVRLFQNLIGNALKYHRAGVPPMVRVDARRADGREWIFSVHDNGQGIAPEYRQRIFDLFQRLHGHEISGAGIGLAICKKIVERHGGRIWVESEVGQGSTFLFTLPAVDAPPR
jgi:PAS domain S-box-containing protein